MPAPRSFVRRPLIASVAIVSLMALAGCAGGGAGGGSASSAAKENPFGLQQADTLRVGTLTDAPPNVFLKDGKSPVSTMTC